MSKIRVYELAKMLGLSNKELMRILEDLGVDVKTHMSSIDAETAQIIEESLGETKASSKSSEAKEESRRTINVPSGASVSDVAKALGVKPAEAVKALLEAGKMVPAGAVVGPEIMDILSKVFNVKIVLADSAEEEQEKDKLEFLQKKKPEGKNLQPRAPIITVMGHVDHGKTSLLDYMRKTKVTEREAGGITQHIGASTLEYNGRKIVFLDTPGHEAFTSMRARGAQVTDIVILVVAADDGVMPQTVEALNHAKASGVPIVVAVNKIDKPEARPDRVRQQLSEHGLIPEEWGGDTIFVDISAKTGVGVDQLLEMVLLVADMNELKADPTVPPCGVIIEAKLDRGKGPVATVIVQEGTLRVGNILVSETSWGKVRAMIDDRGRTLKEAGPSTAVEILGFNDVPSPGETFKVVSAEKEARALVDRVKQEEKAASAKAERHITLEELYDKMSEGETPALRLVLKCDVQGSLEALKGSLKKLQTEEVEIDFIHEGVGRISESDVMLASASDAIIIGFNVRPDAKAKKLAEAEGIQIRLYNVIYDLIDDVKSALEGMLAPTLREQTLGQAEIRAVFKVPKIGKVAGCYVLEGVIRRNAKIRIVRDGIVIWNGSLDTLKRFKDDVREVAAGYECGMSFTNFQDFNEGDIVEAYEVVEEKRTLE
ncbi:translation initiation factor IF-2 [Thermovirga sp.]|nr:translation initiation factor IF-2 [Thermovirga sp.]MBO8153498.1 translation initiation factor IF-2 [Thermovirga sp.]